jgi:hypothetical protein
MFGEVGVRPEQLALLAPLWPNSSMWDSLSRMFRITSAVNSLTRPFMGWTHWNISVRYGLLGYSQAGSL